MPPNLLIFSKIRQHDSDAKLVFESFNGIQTIPDGATHIKLSREYAFELRIRLYLAIFNLKLSKDYSFPGKFLTRVAYAHANWVLSA